MTNVLLMQDAWLLINSNCYPKGKKTAKGYHEVARLLLFTAKLSH